MEEFKVDIKFPAREAEEKDLIVITGAEENVYDCRDQLLNMQEEYVSGDMDTRGGEGGGCMAIS